MWHQRYEFPGIQTSALPDICYFKEELFALVQSRGHHAHAGPRENHIQTNTTTGIHLLFWSVIRDSLFIFGLLSVFAIDHHK
jgi:hypothetical protein